MVKVGDKVRILVDESAAPRGEIVEVNGVDEDGNIYYLGNYRGATDSIWISGEGSWELVIDAVNHPTHYTQGKHEVIDVIADWDLNFDRGSAVKYIVRAGKKDPSKEVEDLEKAIYVLQHEVNQLKEKN